MTRWSKDRPGRVIAYYAGVLLAFAVLLVDSILTGGVAWVVGSALVLCLLLLDAGVHVPRARRAMREARPR